MIAVWSWAGCHRNLTELPDASSSPNRFFYQCLKTRDDTGIVINSVLCFTNSARSSYDSLSDVIYSLYSHEKIKVAKELLCKLLKKDIVWRRDPDKKRKELKGILDFHDEFKSLRLKVDLVTKSHKMMPPDVGLGIFAPILTNLSEETR